MGYSEKLLKLTEVFLPMEPDNKIRDRMDAYNRAKMPHLKIDKMIAFKRKNAIKNEIKIATEKSL